MEDADALCAEVSARSAKNAYAPRLQEEYPNREFAVGDLDGYLLAGDGGPARE